MTEIGPSVRTMQIIAGALLAGVVSFFAVALVLAVTNSEPPRPALISYVAAGMLVVNSMLSLVLPTAIVKGTLAQLAKQPADGDTTRLLLLKQTSMIVGLALLEAVGMTACIALLIERQLWVISVIVVVIAFMALRFPSAIGVEAEIDQWRRSLDELRAH